MIRNFKNPMVKIVYGTLSALLICGAANAATKDVGTLYIRNDLNEQIVVSIEPVTGEIMGSNKENIQTITVDAKRKVEKIVDSNVLGYGKFNVVGNKKGVIADRSDTCENLLAGSNYNVVFSPNKTGGLTCQAQKTNGDDKK